MFRFLKNHPFPVEAWFRSSIVLTFAVPKEELRYLLPECLEPDTFQDKWGFLAIAMVNTTRLRPKGFPAFIGNDFILIGYRIFVRYQNTAGKNLRGLYILKSETNKKRMELLGNIFTGYKYKTTDIDIRKKEDLHQYQSRNSDFHFTIDHGNSAVNLPPGSPFSEWREARRFAGPLPFTFSYNPENRKVIIVEGIRSDWKPEPVQVTDHHFGFLESFKFSSTVLANAFEIKNIPYYWKKGRTELWK